MKGTVLRAAIRLATPEAMPTAYEFRDALRAFNPRPTQVATMSISSRAISIVTLAAIADPATGRQRDALCCMLQSGSAIA